MSKYGSSSAWFLVDGYDMTVNKLQGLRYKIESLTEPTHGLGDTWEEHSAVGMCRAELAQEGAFFFSDANYLHALDSTTVGGQGPSSTARVVCIGVAGNTSGNYFTGIKGEYEQDYEVLAQNGKLTRANASYVVTGNAEQGKIIIPLQSCTSGGIPNRYVDNAVATTNGGASYVQVTALDLDGCANLIIYTYCAAASSGPYTTIGTVTTTGTGAWRVATTSDTVDRWTVAVGTFTTGTSAGTPTATFFVGVTRV